MCPLFYFWGMHPMKLKFDGSPILESIVSLADLKEHLRVEHDEEDDLITGMRAAAISYAEEYCNIKLGQYACTGYLDSFTPSYIPSGPVASLTAVNYKATDYSTDLTTLNISRYYYDIDTTPARINFHNVPALAIYEYNRVQITMSVGYTTSAVPASIIAALKLIVGHMYENRQAETMNLMPYSLRIGVEALLNPFRIVYQP